MIRALRPGSVIDAADIANRPEAFMVLSACGHSAPGYYCNSCRRYAANLYQLEMHAEPSVQHDVVVYCATCRCYRASDQTLLDSIDPARKLALDTIDRSDDESHHPDHLEPAS